MSNKSVNGFVHSLKVPQFYKETATIVKKVTLNGESLKTNLYSCKHKNLKGIYALAIATIKYSKELDKIISKLDLFRKEPRLEPWLARVLLTQLIFRKKQLQGDCKPIQTILSYQKKFDKIFNSVKGDIDEKKALKPRYVRINTLRLTCDEAIKLFREEGWNFIPPVEDYSAFLEVISELNYDSFIRDFHIKELLVFPPKTEFHGHYLAQNGSLLLQDKASCLPTVILQPEPKSTVLDMCSAPGLKTTHLSAILRNKGQIYATEMHQERFKILENFISKSGCTNVKTLNLDALTLNPDDHPWCNDVEYILLDPSCSGSGMTDRRNIFAKETYDPERLRKLSAFQFRLLYHALTAFPKVKRVVYSTCSTQTQENEQVVHDVLNKVNIPIESSITEEVSVKSKKKNKGKNKKEAAKLTNNIQTPKFKLVNALKETWPRRGSSDFEFGQSCLFADPDLDSTNGFFVAVFEKVEENHFIEKQIEKKETDTNLDENSIRKKNKKSKKLINENQRELESDGLLLAEELNAVDSYVETNKVKKKKDKKRKSLAMENELESTINEENTEMNSISNLEEPRKTKRKKNNDEDDEDTSEHHLNRKKKKSKDINHSSEDLPENENVVNSQEEIELTKKKKKKKSRSLEKEQELTNTEEDFKSKSKEEKHDCSGSICENVDEENKKKRKKKKRGESLVDEVEGSEELKNDPQINYECIRKSKKKKKHKDSD